MLRDLFHAAFYEPILNALVWFYAWLPPHDLGLAIILLTLLLRAAMHPLSVKALRSQRALQDLQPKIKALKERNRRDPQAATREMMALYRQHGVNPFGSFGLLLVQIPILFALYRVLLSAFDPSATAFADDLYGFSPHPGTIASGAFGGAIDLAERSLFLAVIAGALQFLHGKLAITAMPSSGGAGRSDFAKAFAVQMRYVFPVMITGIAASLPAGIALYFVVTTVFSVGQQIRFNRTMPPPALHGASGKTKTKSKSKT